MNIRENNIPVVSNATDLNFNEPDTTLITASGAQANVAMTDYLLRSGRPGTGNDSTISSSADGTFQGSTVAGHDLILRAVQGSGSHGVRVQTNGLGGFDITETDRMIIGPGSDPTSPVIAGGLLKFLVASNLFPYFGGFGAGSGTVPSFFGIHSGGTVAAPTATPPGQALLVIAGIGYDAANNVDLSGGGTFLVVSDSAGPFTGYVAAGFLFQTTNISGTRIQAMSINSAGNVGVTNSLVAAPFINTPPTNASCGIEVKSTTQALVTARMNSTQETALTAVDGMDIYNTTLAARRARVNGSFQSLTTINDHPATFTAQTADIADTAFANVTAPGTYRVSVYLVDTTADLAAGAVTAHIKFTDNSTVAQDVAVGPVALTTAGAMAQSTIVVQLASGSLTYGTTHTGGFGTAAYDLTVVCERLA